jgi:hypothetical protein
MERQPTEPSGDKGVRFYKNDIRKTLGRIVSGGEEEGPFSGDREPLNPVPGTDAGAAVLELPVAETDQES